MEEMLVWPLPLTRDVACQFAKQRAKDNRWQVSGIIAPLSNTNRLLVATIGGFFRGDIEIAVPGNVDYRPIGVRLRIPSDPSHDGRFSGIEVCAGMRGKPLSEET